MLRCFVSVNWQKQNNTRSVTDIPEIILSNIEIILHWKGVSNIVNVLYAALLRDCRTDAGYSSLRLNTDFVKDVACIKHCHVNVARTTGNVTVFWRILFFWLWLLPLGARMLSWKGFTAWLWRDMSINAILIGSRCHNLLFPHSTNMHILETVQQEWQI